MRAIRNSVPAMKRLVASLIGAIAMLSGLLWFLQGAAIVQVCPILCFADCECLAGGSVVWEAAGAIAFMIGVAIIWLLRTGR